MYVDLIPQWDTNNFKQSITNANLFYIDYNMNLLYNICVSCAFYLFGAKIGFVLLLDEISFI